MKIVKMSDIVGTDLEVHCPKGGFTSFRMLLAKDGMGFSVSKTVIPRGDTQHWHYTRHLEACYCVSGKGVLQDLATGALYMIEPDMVYALDNHDDHKFKALEDTVLISVFNPPVTGHEVHLDDGSYALPIGEAA